MGKVKYLDIPPKSNWLDYTMLLLIIALTAFQFCFNSRFGVFFIVGPLALITVYLRHRSVSKDQLIFLSVLLIWESFQVIYGQSAFSAMTNFFIRMLIYILAACAINEFEKVFVKLIVIFAAISLPFWFFKNYIPGGYDILSMLPEVKINGLGMDPLKTSNPGYSLGFYFLSSGSRNSGPFWEAGMFGVFLNIAFLFHLLHNRKPFDKYSIILILAIVTTFSTTTYIAFFFIILWYFYIIDFKPRSILLVILIGIGAIAFINSEFGLSKITNNAADTNTYSRFGAMAYHFKLLSNTLFIGRGFASNELTQIAMSPNGITFVFMFWGLPFAFYYYYLLFKSSKKISIELTKTNSFRFSFLTFLTFLIVVFSQDITGRHFYFFLLMYGLYPIQHRTTINLK